MRDWWATRTSEQREHHRRAVVDAHVDKVWLKVRLPKGRTGREPGARNKLTMAEATQLRTLRQVEQASVKRILKDLVGVQPELIRDAIIAGLLAPPPRSFPYVALAAAYLDGKPVDAEPANPQTADLSSLTRDELLARALAVASRLQKDSEEREVLVQELQANRTGLAIIDVTPIPEESPAEELARLNAEVAEAQAEVVAAQAELDQLARSKRNG
jgi:hypothetical protein